MVDSETRRRIVERIDLIDQEIERLKIQRTALEGELRWLEDHPDLDQ